MTTMNVKRWIAVAAAVAGAVAILRWRIRLHKAEENLSFEDEERRPAAAA